MPANQFICPPTGDKILMKACLRNCPHHARCMAKTSLATLANSAKDRGLQQFSVTELLAGTRETYLRKKFEYAVNPQDLVFAAHGSALHQVTQANSDPNVMTEVRLSNELVTGQLDAYGQDLVSRDKFSLIDYKTTSSYKLMKALGYHKVEVASGEFYRYGVNKGRPKMKKVLRTDGYKDLLDWAIQVNVYRMLLEEQGHRVDNMYIQAYVRDFSLRSAAERGIAKPMYLIPINRISDHWLSIWLKEKKRRLDEALATGKMPEHCSKRENWDGRKCQGYCPVSEHCHYGSLIKGFNPDQAKENREIAKTEAA